MDFFETLRTDAADLHAALVRNGADPRHPEALTSAAIAHLKLKLEWVEPDDPTLKGARALYDQQLGLLCCASELDPAKRLLMLAHEIGHVRIHSTATLCRPDDIDLTRSTEAALVGLERVEDYGAHERREQQANVYGRELLFPRTLARQLHLNEELTASEISQRLGLPKDLVRLQIIDALLLPNLPEPPGATTTDTLQEDDSQERAAAHRDSAFLLQAGPGAGKTRTLVKRLTSLLAENVDPASILVLTFSNRAAGELAERITASAGSVAQQIWIGTFHAFGLDLIRRFHAALQLPADPILFDRSDAIEVLEEILPTLPLKHYRNLWDPAMVLRDIVNTISRAKDELVGPTQFRQLCEDMKLRAKIADEHEAAEKASEVAHVYELYERALRERNAVDFGDLIMRPALLLESHDSHRTTVQLRHRHVLVDEYQDVNRASTRLLRAIAGDGRRLWVVGDSRQSIYRFRGASSQNLPRFQREYPDAQTAPLEVNYRSRREILDLVEGFAGGMDASAGMLPLQMKAARGKSGRRPQVRRYQYQENEIAGIAANIRDLESAGVPLRAQAVLCRTNSRLNDIAAGLDARGIAVLHLGSLFERTEIRDCLALLSLAIDPYAVGLVRIATMPRYRMSLEDVRIITSVARSAPDIAIPKFQAIANDSRLSPEGAASLARLGRDLQELTSSHTPWEFLATWLLDRTRHVAECANDSAVFGRMRGIALWQFLNFVRTPGPPVQGPPIRRLLDRVRQMVLLAEERDLRQVPANALRMDAVRLMTIHGSKGLEFEAVHVPGLVSTGLPASPRGQRCPPPDGMIEGMEEGGDDSLARMHEREEECLFFVAASRAESHLCLTLHAKQDGQKNRSESKYLPRIARFADELGSPREIPRPTEVQSPEPVRVSWPAGWHPTDRNIRDYASCARRFFYTHVLKLGVARKPTAFSRTLDCLYEVIEWMAESRPVAEPTIASSLAQFERIWARRGPTDHAFATEYQRLATRLVETLVRIGAGRRFQASKPLVLDLPNGRVHVQPDEIAQFPDGAIVLRKVNTGSKRSNEYDRIEYALYTLAGRANYGPSCRFEAVHLADGDDIEPISITEKKIDARKATSNALLGSLHAGHFPPDPDPTRCPRCPHFFICDAIPHGSLSVSA